MSTAGGLSEVSYIPNQLEVCEVRDGAVSPGSSEDSFSTNSPFLLSSEEETDICSSQALAREDSGGFTPDEATSATGDITDPDTSVFESGSQEEMQIPKAEVFAQTAQESMEHSTAADTLQTVVKESSQTSVLGIDQEDSVSDDGSHEEVVMTAQDSTDSDSSESSASSVSQEESRDSVSAETRLEFPMATQHDGDSPSTECPTTYGTQDVDNFDAPRSNSGVSAQDGPGHAALLMANRLNAVVAESGRSELSPFAEPFTPRVSFPAVSSDSANTAQASSNPQGDGVGYIPTPHSGSGQSVSNTPLPMLDGPCQQILPRAYLQDVLSFDGSRLKQVKNKTETHFTEREQCFGLFFNQPAQQDPLPIGHGRSKTGQLASSTTKGWNGPGARCYSTSSDDRLMKDLCTKLGSLMTDAPTDPEMPIANMNSDFVTSGPATTFSDKGTRQSSLLDRYANLPEHSSRGLRRSASCLDSMAMYSVSNSEGFHRVTSSPQLQSNEQCSGKSDLQSTGTDRPRRYVGNGQDVGKDSLTVNQTPLAEPKPEWDDISPDLSSHLWVWNGDPAPWKDVRIKCERDITSREWRQQQQQQEGTEDEKSWNGYAKRLSADSGFGSLSDSCKTLSVAKTSEADLDMCQGGVPGRGRLCAVHHQELTMYCIENCVLMCQLCRADHAACQRVMNISSACRDVKNRLLKVQSALDGHIHTLQRQSEELKPKLGEIAEKKKQARDKVHEFFLELMKSIRESHKKQLEDLQENFDSMEKGTSEKTVRVEQTLGLLKAATSFVETLRCQDSGWNLLSTYDQRLSIWLNKVVQTAEFSQTYIDSIDSEKQKLDDCRQVAYNSVEQLMDGDMADDDYELPLKKIKPADEQATGDNADAEDWSVRYREEVASGFTKEADWKVEVDTSSMIPNREYTQTQTPDSIEILKYELQEFEKNCSSKLQMTTTGEHARKARPSLYGLLDEDCLHTPSDFYDEVFLYDSTKPHDESPPSAVFQRQVKYESSVEYKVQQRLSVNFPEDRERVFVTDMHVTDTGFLVYLDAANNCMKRFYLPQVSRNPSMLPVNQPLCLCSAGWERVMVSSAGRTLAVYNVGGHGMQQVLTRTTQHQYRGLVRASDSLVAAACPETHSVHLLDLAGRALRSIMPVDFVRGPEVVGVTQGGQLLVVHQPSAPPTLLVCFDMLGTVLWSRPLHTAARHVSCCKVAGGQDGYVYLALQGDSVLYRVDPNSQGTEAVLLNSRHGVKLPSSLALLADGSLLVTRNQLPSPSVPSNSSSSSNPPPMMLPNTTEIDVFVPHNTTTKAATSDRSVA